MCLAISIMEILTDLMMDLVVANNNNVERAIVIDLFGRRSRG